MKTQNNSILMQNKIFVRLAIITGMILLIPLIAMQFTQEVNWTRSDFIVMGALIFGIGSLFILISRKIQKKYRLPLAIAFAFGFFWLWAELAVGIFTNWGS